MTTQDADQNGETTYPTGRKRLEHLLDLLDREEAGDPDAPKRIRQTIARCDKAGRDALWYLPDELASHCYRLGWLLRGLSKTDRIEECDKFHPLICPPDTNRYRRAGAVQFVRGLFGREYTFPSQYDASVEDYQPEGTDDIRRLPDEIVTAFVDGLSQVDIDPPPQSSLNRFAAMKIAGTTYPGACTPPLEEWRGFGWWFKGPVKPETAYVDFWLSFAFVEGRTRRYCSEALRKLVSKFRKLGHQKFAEWVITRYPGVRVRDVLAMLSSKGKSRYDLAIFAFKKRPKMNVDKEVIPMLVPSKAVSFKAWVKSFTP